MSRSLVDGVERCPLLDVKVVVIGGGVGGLLAALECWRKGCDVVVLEKSKDISPLGDFFTIPPSALSTLKHYPSMRDVYEKNIYDCTISIWTPQGKCVKSTTPEWRRAAGKESRSANANVSFLNRRPVFTRMLYDQCIRLGIPVCFSHDARDINEDDNHVVVTTSENGSFQGDICVVANGIGSPSMKDIIGVDQPVLDSGYATARMAFPRNAIPTDSLAQQLLEGVDIQPEFRVYLSNDIHLILFLTKDYVAFAFTHQSDGHAAESWHNLRDSHILVEQLEQKCTAWDPAVLDFIKHIPGKVVDWGLRFRDPVEQWTSTKGRIIALGDAAHTYLPTAGNGAVQACEDAISLAECLAQGGKSGAPWATKVHNKLRFERTSILQQAGFINRDELHDANLDDIAEQPESDIGFFKIGRWVWDHNPELYAAENYAKCLQHLRDGSEFRSTNIPPGHVYRPWSMESENARRAAGVPPDLKSNGYWGV